MIAATSTRTRTTKRSLILLAIAISAFALAAWAERQQEHSYLWTADGDRLNLAAFMAPAHHHSRKLPWNGIERISDAEDLENPEYEILVLHYGPVAFRMPSQNDHNIRRFDNYAARLDAFLTAVRAGDENARVLYLDPYLLVTAAAIVASLAAWVIFFVTILRPPDGGPQT